MTFNEYQNEAIKTNIYPDDKMLHDLVLGLCSEAGEVADKLKKYDRDSTYSTDENTKLIQDVFKELGDVLWYVSNIADKLELTLDDVAKGNLIKLASRKDRDKINGSGDDR